MKDTNECTTLDSLRFEMIENQIGVITLSRPKVMNALNTEVFHELQHLLAALSACGKIRGLIITGEGRAFAAGADLGECVNAGMEENRAYSALAQETFNMVDNFSVPTIAAVNGYALGGGCELSLCCDIRIAGEKAKFGQPEVGIGVIPCFGGTQRLPKIVGMGMAKEMVFTGRKITAEEALKIGLVNRVVPQDQLMNEAVSLMKQITENSATALRYAKIAMSRGSGMTLENGLELERDLSALCYGLPDKEEGMRAFFEKRKPKFSL